MYIESENLLSDIKLLNYAQLQILSDELRERLIQSVSKTGGHLASNLGAVELTVALHRVFDSPVDKIVFDVGHQAYVHKMLTGRLDKMESLRQLDGISGFPKRSESVHDCCDSGHTSSSVSVAYGMAKARDIKGEDYNCVAVIGDGALTGGVAYEALNAAGSSDTPLIVVLNDNEMSIAHNVGSVAGYLQGLRTSKSYLNLKSGIKKALADKPVIYDKLEAARDKLKYSIMAPTMFEELGFKYYGPIDGHNIEEMCRAFEVAKLQKRPVIVHVVTQKGKGFAAAEQNPSKYHGIGPFNPEEEAKLVKDEDKSYSAIFGSKLARLASADKNIVAVSAAMIDATGLREMKDRFPERTFDVGIAEQNAVSFAAGMALNGLKPVVAIYSTFLQRAYDQISTEVCLMNLPVVFAIDRAGVTGRDGETHQGNFDIAYLSALPNMTVLAPKDGRELQFMLEEALKMNGPVAIRYPREDTEDLSADSSLSLDAEELCPGNDFALIACGSMVKEALKSRELLKERGIDAAVWNLRRIKPLQTEAVDLWLKKYNKIVVCEDGCLNGGAGSAIAAYAASNAEDARVLCLGWPDKYIEHGSIAELRCRYRLDAQGIAERSEAFFEDKA